MKRFLVSQEWDSDDDFDVATARTIEASDAQYAAEKYMEDYHHDMDFASETTVKVREFAGGGVTRWRVVAEQVMRVNAEEIKLTEEL